MREILFRGRRLDNGEWVTGHLLRYEDGRARINQSHTDIFCYEKDDSIIQTVAFRVDPATVGQYTGLTDQNDKKVFEGDIVKMHYFFENYAPGTLGAFEDEEVLDVVIKIDKYGVSFETLDHEMSGYLCDYLQDPEAELEIFGNIYDNPELMGGEKK